MLLKNFSNERGRIWVGDGKKVYASKPKDVFVQGHLYTKLDLSNVQGIVDSQAFLESVPKSYEFEERLGEIEGAAAPDNLQCCLETAGRAGRFVTDAHLAALALDHDADIHSADQDFRIFPNVRWHNPL